MRPLKPIVYAHRGFSGVAPENTLAAFKKAVEAGATGIELDVQLTADGVVVVMHDEKVDRTTTGQGLLVMHTKAQLDQLDAGSWFAPEFAGEKVPTLEEVLDLVHHKPIKLNIELKTGVIEYPELEEKVLKLVKAYRFEDYTLYSSFNHYSLEKIKSLNPRARVGLLYVAGLYEPWEYAKRLNADALHPLFYGVRPELVIGAHAAGLEVNTYTVNEEYDLRTMVEIGVDGIITNYPDRLLKILQED